MPEDLVPASAPKLRHRRGHPGLVRDAGPLRGRLAKYDLAEERADVVHYFDGGVDDDHGAEGDRCYEEKARKWAEGLVEDGATFEAGCGWTNELHEVVRCIECDDLDKEFEELSGNRWWWAWVERERLG